jgi:FSR family fosmidomycin resistance protein-like MFS transporter
VIARLLPEGIDRRALAALTAGHVGSDVFQGAVPALVPFYVRERGWSYAAAGLLVLIGSLGSSLLQPLAGAIGDRLAAVWLIPAGLLLASAGLVTAGLVESYSAVMAGLALGGLGVAVFHPEAVRAARHAAGPHPGSALGVFAVGGNAGFALGPALIAPCVLLFGLSGAALVGLVPLLAAAVIAVNWRRIDPRVDSGAAVEAGLADDWPLFALASSAAIARTAYMFGLMAFVPAWFAASLGHSVQLGSAAISAMLAAGAFGTYLGGRLSDRFGQPRVIVWSLVLVVPMCALLPFSPVLVVIPLLVLIGVTMDANFYPLVIVAQNALPDRVGFASGVVIGISVGVGAGVVALLGVVADHSGLTTTLHACTGLAALAALLALPIGLRPLRRPLEA